MSINKTYAVFGLGRYGTAVAMELIASGADVLAVDIDENVVNNAMSEIPICKCADVTDEEVLRQLGISNIDVVIVAMASNLEASVMAVTLCKEAGVETVIAKCGSEMHRKILTRVGANKVLLPEQESGIRLAKNLVSSGFVDMVELSDDFSIVELDIKPQWEGKTLLELNLRRKCSINVIGIRENDKITIEIDPELRLDNTMRLIVIADNKKLSKIK